MAKMNRFQGIRSRAQAMLSALVGDPWRQEGDTWICTRTWTCTAPRMLSSRGGCAHIEVGVGVAEGVRLTPLAAPIHLEQGLTLGRAVELTARGPLRCRAHGTIDHDVRIATDGPALELGSGVRVGRLSRVWAHTGPLHIGDSCVLGEANTWIATGRGITIASHCDFTHAVTLDSAGGSIEMATGSGVGPNSVLYGHGGLRIGSGVAIAGLSMLVPGNHRFAQLDKPIRAQGTEPLPISIGDDVWIGAGVMVLGGSSISDGCVIGAGSVVRGQLPPRVVAAGVPARIIRSRDAAPHS